MNDWLEKEMRNLRNENAVKDFKISKRWLIKLTLMLTFIFASSYAVECPVCNSHLDLYIYKPSAQWRCLRCGRYNYSEDCDWMGDFYCGHCGCKKGEE